MKQGDLITLKRECRNQYPGRNYLIVECMLFEGDPGYLGYPAVIVLADGELIKMLGKIVPNSYEVCSEAG